MVDTLDFARRMTRDAFSIYFQYKSCEFDEMSVRYSTLQAVFAQNQLSSHGCELHHRVVYLAMRRLSLIITRCGEIYSLVFVCFE